MLLEFNPCLAKHSTFGALNSPLHFAAAKGHNEIVTLLLENGADVNSWNYCSQGLTHFNEILQEADGIILSRGNLGFDLPAEKAAIFRCNMAGKPAVVTRVGNSMTDNLRPTRAEATDVANVVLDGSDAIILEAETLRGLSPVETISTVGRICAEEDCQICWRTHVSLGIFASSALPLKSSHP